MLVLARQKNESIMITTPTGEEITIIVVDAAHGRARLGIDAPSDCVILREELLEEN